MSNIPLTNVAWVSTRQCNLTCTHCYARAGEVKEKTMDKREVERYILDEMVNLKSEFFSITGGEPLLREDLWQIIEAARSRGLKVTLATNGTLINKNIATNIVKSGISSVQISLDGATDKINDNIRGEGTFEVIYKSIQEICSSGVKVAISFTPMKSNLEELRSVVELAVELGAKEVSVRRFVAIGRGEEIQSQALSLFQRRALFGLLLELQRDFHQEIRVATNDPLFCTVDDRFRDLVGDQNVIGGCSAGIFGLAIQSNGEVTPCTGLNINLGNVMHEPLSKIWNSSSVLIQLRCRDNLKGKCGACDYRNICGGCREAAYQQCGNVLGEDKDCIL